MFFSCALLDLGGLFGGIITLIIMPLFWIKQYLCLVSLPVCTVKWIKFDLKLNMIFLCNLTVRTLLNYTRCISFIVSSLYESSVKSPLMEIVFKSSMWGWVKPQRKYNKIPKVPSKPVPHVLHNWFINGMQMEHMIDHLKDDHVLV